MGMFDRLFGKTPPTASELIESLGIPTDSGVLATSIVALGETRAPEAVEPLMLLLGNLHEKNNFLHSLMQDKTVSTDQLDNLIIDALRKIGEPTFSSLRTLASKNPTNNYRVLYAARVLTRLQDPGFSTNPAKMATFRDDFAEAARLGKIAVAPLCERLDLEGVTSRYGNDILKALASIRDPSSVECLVRHFDSHNYQVEEGFAVVFRSIADVRLVKALLRGLEQSKFHGFGTATLIAALTDAVRLSLRQSPTDMLRACGTVKASRPTHPTGDGKGGWASEDIDCSRLHEIAKRELSRRAAR